MARAPYRKQPGQGAPTGGTGKDADGGKGRTQFEDDRRNGNAGGKDRPEIYKPNDDGNRDGYINRLKPGPKKKKLTIRDSLINKIAGVK